MSKGQTSRGTIIKTAAAVAVIVGAGAFMAYQFSGPEPGDVVEPGPADQPAPQADAGAPAGAQPGREEPAPEPRSPGNAGNRIRSKEEVERGGG